MIEKVLYYPITMAQGSGAQVLQSAPVVDDLTPGSTGVYPAVALVKDVGTYVNGLFMVGTMGTWRRVLPYLTLSDLIFDAAIVYCWAPNAGTTVLPTAGLQTPRVYRNAAQITAYTQSGSSIVLTTPSQTNDTFCVISLKTGGGGGIADAPNDGLAYVRKSLNWSDLNLQTLTEGTYGS
jgi:hypothetical protein